MKKLLVTGSILLLLLLLNILQINAQSFNQAIRTLENFEPAISRSEQDKAIVLKLMVCSRYENSKIVLKKI